MVGPHVEPLRGAIHALKYQDRTALAVPLGHLLAERWLDVTPQQVDGLVPVPLHPQRLRERGYNQATLLASAMAPVLALPIQEGLLRRERPTPPQVGLAQQARLRNVAGAFQATGDVAGGRWLLVDDVCTTGATLQACAQTLHAAGADTVWAITLTRPH